MFWQEYFMKYVFLVLFLFSPQVFSQDKDTAKIEELTHLKGNLNEKEGVFKVTFPRSDLKVTAAGVKMTPVMGLTAWTAFYKMKNHYMIMGDIVMTEDQVNDVMDAALDNGLEVTALHNHFFEDKPKIMFMHIGGMGTLEILASGVGKVFDTLKATAGGKGKFPHANIDTAKSRINGIKIDAILGRKGQDNSGVYKVTIGRTVKMSGAEVGNEMGINTWAAFAGTDNEAVVDGDFVMFQSELQRVLKALRGHGINIVAIHNHMIDEEPRTVFLHFWGIGPAEKLARGLRAALDVSKP